MFQDAALSKLTPVNGYYVYRGVSLPLPVLSYALSIFRSFTTILHYNSNHTLMKEHSSILETLLLTFKQHSNPDYSLRNVPHLHPSVVQPYSRISPGLVI